MIFIQILLFKKKLQKSKTYTCDDSGQVICHQGWSGIEKLCTIPVCDFGNNQTCVHGNCVAPNHCACEIGWEGIQCDSCITLPGCQNGHCQNEPFECICDETEKWTGDHCDERKKFQNYNIYSYIPALPQQKICFCFSAICKTGCEHGTCKNPGECL